MSFNKWVRECEKKIEPLMDKAIKEAKGLVPEGKEEKLQKAYFEYKINQKAKIAQLISIISLMISLASIAISLWLK